MAVSVINPTAITVQWEAVSCIEQNGDITGYIVWYGSQTQSVSGGSVTETTISNLTPSTTYNIEVAAMNNADTGPFSNSIFIMTLGITYQYRWIEIHIFSFLDS